MEWCIIPSPMIAATYIVLVRQKPMALIRLILLLNIVAILYIIGTRVNVADEPAPLGVSAKN